MSVSADDIRRAAEAIRGRVVETPCLYSKTLSSVTGAEVFLKFENLQFTASFKERGALHALLSLDPKVRGRGVVAMSAGNHALAVAHHAQQLGVPALIVMPRLTPTNKVEHTRALGAEVVLHGGGFDDAASFARELAERRGLHLLHPFDDADVIAGQGTVALEMLEARPDLEVLVVPVGGGGLVAGCAVAAKSERSGIEVVGVETQRFPSMLCALDGVPAECGPSTIAEGIAVREPGRLTLEIARERVDKILLVDEEPIERAVLLLLEVEKTVVEGAGAVGLAALLSHPERFAGRRVGLILSGGNIDLFVLSSIIQRGLARSGRLVRLFVELADRPGTLAEVSACISATDAAIVEVVHQRSFSDLPVQSVAVEFVVQTRGLDHLQRIVETLEAGGFKPRLAAGPLDSSP